MTPRERRAAGVRRTKPVFFERGHAQRPPLGGLSTLQQRVTLAKDGATAVVLLATISGYALLGMYFWHIERFPLDWAALGGLAPAAFGVGLVLLVAMPVFALFPTVAVRACGGTALLCSEPSLRNSYPRR